MVHSTTSSTDDVADPHDEDTVRILVNISGVQAQNLERIMEARGQTDDQVMSTALTRVFDFEEMTVSGQRFFVEKQLPFRRLRRLIGLPTHRSASQLFYFPPGANYWERERIMRRSTS